MVWWRSPTWVWTINLPSTQHQKSVILSSVLSRLTCFLLAQFSGIYGMGNKYRIIIRYSLLYNKITCRPIIRKPLRKLEVIICNHETDSSLQLQPDVWSMVICQLKDYGWCNVMTEVTRHPKFYPNVNGAHTHDLQIMDSIFHVPEMSILTTELSSTFIIVSIEAIFWDGMLKAKAALVVFVNYLFVLIL